MIFLRDDRGLRHRHHDLAGARSTLCNQALDGFRDLIKLFDLAVGDPALFETFGAESLKNILASGSLTEFHQLHAG